MEAVRCDYIIVGLGLAGCALAEHLLAIDRSVAIVHSDNLPSSSRVAAGLFNPVTGRKMVKTWKADALFPYLNEYYRAMEAKTGTNFLTRRPIYRPFMSVDEQNDWAGKSADPEFKNYILSVHTSSRISWVNDPAGGILLDQSGYLDTPKYLEAMKTYLRQRCTFMNERFDMNKLHPEAGGVRYGHLQASKIIFCEGVGMEENELFKWLPFRPVKGEILDITFDGSSDWIINRGVFMIQTGEGTFRVGSTYNNSDRSWQTTHRAKSVILEKLNMLVTGEINVIAQTAGIRPASADRRPIAGYHPGNETFVVFNGLGTKGVSLSPYYARQLAGYLGGLNELDTEVNINRYFSLY